MKDFTRRTLLGLLGAMFLSGVAPDLAEAAPIPTVAIQTESASLLNEQTTINLSYTNTGDAIGYYPMIEVKLPAGVTCDAACVSAIAITTPNGAPVTVTPFGPAGGSATFTNPVTGNPVAVTAGESVLFLSLPTGSVSPNEPAVTYSIPAKVSPSAALGVPLPVNATGVFALGSLPNGVRGSCGAGGADTICLASTAANVTPAVLTLSKAVTNLVDGSTATGPNYPRRFDLLVRVAQGKTTTNVVLSDIVPNTIMFQTLPGADCAASPGSVTFTPPLDGADTCVFTGDGNGGGTLTVTYATITGGPTADRGVAYVGYVQEFAGAVGAAIVPPTTGAATASSNTASVDYTYDPGTGAVPLSAGPASVTIQQRSLYTTKSITNDTTGGQTAKPGDTLTHTLIYDVSDYFSFDDLHLTDTISDGQTYVDGSLQVAVFEGSSTALTRSQAQLQAASGAPLAPITRNGATGEWLITLDLSAALTAAAPNGFGADDILEGDDALGSGVPTKVVITYQTTVDEEFTGATLGTPIVSGGDVLTDTMTADFRVAGTANRQTLTGPTATMTITPVVDFVKSIEFLNGLPIASHPISAGFNDIVTFKLAFTVPSGDIEGLVVKDFVPSPLFNVLTPLINNGAASFVFDPTPNDVAPDAGHVHLTTSSAIVSPTISVNGTEDSISFAFDREDAGNSASVHIEILFSIAATNSPLANDLLLANVAFLSHNSSQSATPVQSLSSVASLKTSEPKLQIRKFAQAIVSGTGSITGSGASANFTGVVPGSRLRFGIALENIGNFDAFDVSLLDVSPPGFTIDPATVQFTNCNSSVSLTDSSTSAEINVTSMDIPAGETCSITYEVDLSTTAYLGGVITNIATAEYASTVGGPHFSPESDNATTSIVSPSVAKSFVAGSSTDSSTTGTNLRPGESAEFDVTVTVPPGRAEAFTVRERDIASGGTSSNFFENFTSGTITFPSVEQNAVCGGLFNFVGNTNLCFTLNPNSTQIQSTSTLHRVNLGTVTNSAAGNQTFTFRYRATVRAGLVAGSYTNRADVEWVSKNSTPSGETSQQKSSNQGTAGFTMVRPKLMLAKTTLSTPPLKFGDSAVYRITLTNTGAATAYDVADIVDLLPFGLGTAVRQAGTPTLNGSNVSGATGFSFSQTGQQLTITVRNASGQARLAPGDVFSVTYSVPLTSAVNGTTASLVNIASVSNYSTGPIDGGPRETLTDITPGTTTLSVDSNNIYGRAVFAKETAGSGNQNGVANTTITIIGTSFSTTTDSNGNFSFQGVPDGTYQVRATSSFGDILGTETITVANGDVRNIIFQARPRIVLTKTTSTVGPVRPGDTINYTVTLQNVGNYPAFQVASIRDTLARGLGTASVTVATYAGSSVTGVGGFGISQTGQVVQITVVNGSGQPRINPGDTFLVSYQVTVLSSIPSGQITIPNSAEIASYATTATAQSNTESYLDVRCGEVRIDGAHFSVSGHVRITNTATGIAGAGVEISGGGISLSATTDSEGFYVLPGLPAGVYTVTARTPMGELIESRTVTISNESIIDEDFALDMAVTISKAFNPASIDYGGTSTLTITLTNTSMELQATGVNFADIFPPGMTVATGASISGTCGGTLQGVVGTGAISLSAGTLAPASSCEVTVLVTSIQTGDNSIPAGAGSDQTGPVGPPSNVATLTVGLVDPACTSVSYQSTTTSMVVSTAALDKVINQALGLRGQYAKAGYCAGATASCVPCRSVTARCASACVAPSARDEAAIRVSSRNLRRSTARLTSNSLVSASWALVCDESLSCDLTDLSRSRARILSNARSMLGLATRALNNCCMKSRRAPAAWQRRRADLIRASNQEYNKLVDAVASYPSTPLVCQ